ncbi:MAG: c-type cytochrome [Bacteroidetes bacterium]|nr:c-type cytochrome [Bacteroidota bacterium]
MKKSFLIPVLSAIIFLMYGLSNINTFERSNAHSDSLEAAKQYYADKVSEYIKGREELPADSVFSDIQIMKGMPAGRLVNVMNKGFSKALGVGCDHCHNTNDWASNEKKEKLIAREMMKMSGQIRTMIKDIKEIESKEATINCMTCHRGEIVPATSLK